MSVLYRLAADAIVIVHFGYASFIVVGWLAILLGIALRWQWIRNFWFRSLHLLAILGVGAEAIWGVTCPLTAWEQQLRTSAGQTSYRGDFIAHWVHQMLFLDFPPWVFALCHVLFGLVVLATFVLAPPRWIRKSQAGSATQAPG